MKNRKLKIAISLLSALAPLSCVLADAAVDAASEAVDAVTSATEAADAAVDAVTSATEAADAAVDAVADAADDSAADASDAADEIDEAAAEAGDISDEGAGKEPHTYRILCVGDSITQGGRRSREEYTYRLPLQKLLRERGVSFDFIGSRKGGLEGGAVWPDVAEGVPFDADHDGYYGAKTADAVAKVKAAWNDEAPPPEIVLVHLGTNDQDNTPHEETVQKPLRDLIAFLRTKNPNVAIFLGHLNLNHSKGARSIRPLVEELAKEASTEESPVITVNHFKGWFEMPNRPESDTYDWVHPNPQGQMKMAKAWLEAMTPFIEELR